MWTWQGRKFTQPREPFLAHLCTWSRVESWVRRVMIFFASISKLCVLAPFLSSPSAAASAISTKASFSLFPLPFLSIRTIPKGAIPLFLSPSLFLCRAGPFPKIRELWFIGNALQVNLMDLIENQSSIVKNQLVYLFLWEKMARILDSWFLGVGIDPTPILKALYSLCTLALFISLPQIILDVSSLADRARFPQSSSSSSSMLWSYELLRACVNSYKNLVYHIMDVIKMNRCFLTLRPIKRGGNCESYYRYVLLYEFDLIKSVVLCKISNKHGSGYVIALIYSIPSSSLTSRSWNHNF